MYAHASGRVTFARFALPRAIVPDSVLRAVADRPQRTPRPPLCFICVYISMYVYTYVRKWISKPHIRTHKQKDILRKLFTQRLSQVWKFARQKNSPGVIRMSQNPKSRKGKFSWPRSRPTSTNFTQIYRGGPKPQNPYFESLTGRPPLFVRRHKKQPRTILFHFWPQRGRGTKSRGRLSRQDRQIF